MARRPDGRRAMVKVPGMPSRVAASLRLPSSRRLVGDHTPATPLAGNPHLTMAAGFSGQYATASAVCAACTQVSLSMLNQTRFRAQCTWMKVYIPPKLTAARHPPQRAASEPPAIQCDDPRIGTSSGKARILSILSTLSSTRAAARRASLAYPRIRCLAAAANRKKPGSRARTG